MTVKTRIVRIGNSRGIRLPKTLLDEAQLSDEVELRAEPGRLIVKSARHAREGWAEEAKQMHARGEDRLLDEPTPTQFDEEEWDW
jgi:antitoxin MazE